MTTPVRDALPDGVPPLTGDVLAIRGGRPLRGRVDVKGAKNLATKAMVASLLGETVSVLRDVPAISDVAVVRSLLEVHGVRVSDGDEPGALVFDPSDVESAHFEEIDAHAGASRIPILFCGPLLHRLGQAFIPDLGGCRIGDRPIDFHLDALRKFGAIVEKLPSGIRLSRGGARLHGANIHLPYPSVGATEQVLLTAVRAEGTTELRNAAIEPEIMDLIAVLQKMGAIISYEPNRVILIEGVETLRGYDHRSIFDRNEAASWASAALATDGEIFVGGAKQQEMLTFLNIFRKAGGWFDIQEDGILFRREGELKPVVVETDVHPGFMTDWQQPLVVALTQANGRSVVHETVYENRLGFTDALVKMGADIVVHPRGLQDGPRRVPRRDLEQAAVITGPTPLHAADIVVPDLRGGYSHVIAALTAEGESKVSGVDILSRGYEKFLAKLDAVGADFDVIR
ncbi:UDP-N-acetylglucosamine 1-carboxyvinyltransferase [Microbacterium foliorum]|jgi:UDP-N-acetylglucosamine 1-carboxyvinyltransferase|uniref:UDP-N-acetylglucosamine 1-carboxyvinyltransferase n=1 Tax=Microbacterium foliorum TaxID=104336 RepID=A0ABU1HNC1_9MICO|nr:MULTISPECIES: UDP-N-acetylglucosamine 1-carboxyvinyltransferase [Microbacterium]AQY01386.1 UDP-N-acetylglucosamine 1-carboxyvinyltransferase [Microbacterium foliorum]KIP88144.1 UDP-N-acetylglucosamine 1-carboxyvinyltransferase [Microbacterium sp. MEJ108Y]MDR6141341.1 UDP-N-acetylglucosamine 1-carboxyvinyltransferase [Microbacterium foliorum]